MWCGSCFVPSSLDPCDIALPEDFTGATIEELGEQDRFMVARPGDHLCTSFQCPNCQSQNIRGKDLDTERNIADACFESLCIRAQLDSFWARTKKTVSRHVQEARFMIRYGDALGFTPMPPLGPFRIGQHNGLMQAIILEMRTMEAGRGGKGTVQYSTARKIRGTTTILWETSPYSGRDIVLSSGSVKGRYIATLCPSEGRWYSLFATGISVRMGDIVHQDRAYTLEVVHAVIEMFEAQFQEQGFEMPVRDFEAAMFFIATCTGGFRGYETVWTDLGALRYDMEFCEDSDDTSAVAWPVTGRFKNEHGAWNTYMIPITGVTGSGIRVFDWTQRIIRRMELIGRVDGWLFRKSNNRDKAVAGDYAENIYSKLEVLQQTTSLIDAGCDIREEYGMQRSGRRFFDTQCLNMRVSPTDIEFQCRWRTNRAKGGKTVPRSMLHTYAEVRNMKPTLLRPSQAL
jgi:hypothetical protein